MDVMEFFRCSAGQWKSQRTTHHLAFRRAEIGESEICVTPLDADHPEIISLCELHEIDPALAIGGSLVTWHGSMAWDRNNDEPHDGKTIFALVPDADDARQGRLLRERGYAEIVPVVGRYLMDDEDGLVLMTDYETMSSHERFWFASPDLRLRTSTVKRFGGFSTVSFCTEARLTTNGESSDLLVAAGRQAIASPSQDFSLLGW